MDERDVIPLDRVRTDGWFEELAEGTGNFQQLCEIVGERFVAFSILVGVRITAIRYERRQPDASLVDFVVGEEEEHRLALGEFRRRVVSTLLSDEDPEPRDWPKDTDPETLQAFIGFRYVLLAPIFGLTLKRLRVGGERPPTVELTADGDDREVTVQELRELVRERIRNELQQMRTGSSFAIDLEVVPRAQQANASRDWEKTIELLGAWPGPLSMLLRTAEGQQLGSEVRTTLAYALGLLGTAYVHTGRHEWAEEVMRLGIQWGHDRAIAGDLFRRLGESYVERGREGEAIAILRRGLMLGAGPRDVLPTLAHCYVTRRRYVAAMACVDEAVAAGADPSTVEECRHRVEVVLGKAWERFRDHVPRAGSSVDTVRPPVREAGAESPEVATRAESGGDPPAELDTAEREIVGVRSGASDESESWETH